MARRVNKTFVIGLGVVVLGIAGAGSWVVLANSFRDKDPAFLKEKALEAEKAGDIKAAMSFTYKAADAASKKRTGDADQLYMKLGDMYMSQSDKEPKYYDAARSAWERAQTENPRNIEPRLRLLDENYKIAQLYRQPATWSQLEDASKRVIEVDRGVFRSYTYAAEAILESLRGANVEGVVAPRLKEAAELLAEAAKLMPDAPEPVALRARLLLAESARATQSGQVIAAKALKDQALTLVQEYAKKFPNEPSTSIILMSIYFDQKNTDEANRILEETYKANATDPRIVYVYAEMKRSKTPEVSEAALKKLAESVPEDNDVKFRLAMFYQQMRKGPEAIAQYKAILESNRRGAGIQARKWENWEISSIYSISWINMDLAQQAGMTSEAGKKLLAEGSEYTERLRKLRPAHPLLDVLDGRLQLVRGNVPLAIQLLKRADASFSSSDSTVPQWLHVKLMLAEAYKSQLEWGNALTYLNQIQARYPTLVPVLLERAAIHNRIAEYAKALPLLKTALELDPTNQQALRIQSEAYLVLDMRPEYEATRAKLTDSVPVVLENARVSLMTGDYEGSITALQSILEKDPGNVAALMMSAIAYTQTDRKSDALVFINRALEKAPKNAQLQMMKAAIEQPDADPRDLQKKVIEAIEDPYTRNIALATMYARSGDRKNELEHLYQAEKAVNIEGERGRAQVGELIDRIFTSLMNTAMTTTDAKVKDEMFAKAQTYIEKAERLNLDGTGGKLFEGRWLIAKGDKRQGIATLEQAVAARPDYSMAHTILGQAYLDSERNDLALAEFQKAIEQKPDNLLALKGAIYLLERRADPGSQTQAQNYLGQALSFAPRDRQLQAFVDVLGEPAEAIRQREVEYSRNPGNLDNARRLALLYIRFGNQLRRESQEERAVAKEQRAVEQFGKAAAIFKTLLDKYPEDLLLADNLARMYRETQRPNDALMLYQPFIASKDQKIRYAALMMLGDMHKSMAQMNEAAAMFKMALESQPEGTDEAQRRLADMYFDIDDMKNAEVLYRQIYANSGEAKDMKVLRRLVETLIRQEKFAESLELLDTQVLKQRPDDEEGLVLKGFAQLRQRDAKAALESFNRVLAKNPSNPDALHYRAFSQFFLQLDLEQAARDLIRVREQNQNAIQSRLLLARIYRLARKYSEASIEYRDVVAMRPELLQARLEYADFLMGLVELQQKIPANSIDDQAVSLRLARPTETVRLLLDESMKRFPDQVIWRVMQGNLLSLTGKPAEGLQALQEAFRASGEAPAAASAYLAALLKAKDYEEIITLTTRLIGVRPDYVDYYIKRGISYGMTNKPELALADFDKSLAMASKDLSMFLNVVRQFSGSLQAEPTIKHLVERLKANPGDVPTRVGLAQVYLTSGRSDDAYATAEPLLSDPNAAKLKTLLLRLTALAKYQSKDFVRAKQIYEELLKIEPDDLEALNNLAFLVASDLKKPQEGLIYAERAIKILRTRPVDTVYVNNGNLLDTYGWVKFLNDDYETAARELKRALQIDQQPITFLHLAKVYKAQKRPEEAKQVLNDGIKVATERKDPILQEMEAFAKEF